MITIAELTKRVIDFHTERDWMKFHTPKEVAVATMVEAAELLELFQWESKATPAGITKNREKILDEVGDVGMKLLELAHLMKFDLKKIVEDKMVKSAAKYPVEKAKGSDKKYTEY